MKSNLYLRYVGSNPQKTSEIPLSDLGNSLIGFDHVIREFAHICRLNVEIDVVATSNRQGSQIFNLLIDIRQIVENTPIESTEHLLEFLKLWSYETWQIAIDYFSEIKGIHRSLNDFLKEYPLDLAIFALLIPKLFKLARRQKDAPVPVDFNTPERIAKELYRLIGKKRVWEGDIPYNK